MIWNRLLGDMNLNLGCPWPARSWELGLLAKLNLWCGDIKYQCINTAPTSITRTQPKLLHRTLKETRQKLSWIYVNFLSSQVQCWSYFFPPSVELSDEAELGTGL